MANTLKCDLCGKFYEAYNTRKNPNKPSGVMLVNVDDDGKYWTNKTMYCCPECMSKIQNCINGLKEEK